MFGGAVLKEDAPAETIDDSVKNKSWFDDAPTSLFDWIGNAAKTIRTKAED